MRVLWTALAVIATLVMAAALFVALLWGTAALAQHQHAQLHNQFYKTWLRPEMRTPSGQRQYGCCNDKDCEPARFKNVGGTWYGQKLGTQRWQAIPNRLMEQNQPDPRESPDGSGHLCSTDWHVFCAVLGSGT